jgi:hypothetical protein
MRLRYDAQRQLIARLLLLGWTAERIGKRLGCTARAVRYTISKPKFQELFERLQEEQLKALDHKMSRLLHRAARTLERQLRDRDWRCRASAIETIVKMHGRYIEKRDVSSTVDHTGHVGHVHHHQLEPIMTDEQRALARELLRSFRATHLC